MEIPIMTTKQQQQKSIHRTKPLTQQERRFPSVSPLVCSAPSWKALNVFSISMSVSQVQNVDGKHIDTIHLTDLSTQWIMQKLLGCCPCILTSLLNQIISSSFPILNISD